ncbi:MAG: hypothetical protein ACKOS8_14540 [Gemmataceae bacterium]
MNAGGKSKPGFFKVQPQLIPEFAENMRFQPLALKVNHPVEVAVGFGT